MAVGLTPPRNLKIDFTPSEKQYEVWKCLQPECPDCSGKIEYIKDGIDKNGNATYKPKCNKCGNENIPQIVLEGGSAGGGKALIINELICTPFGFRKLCDLKVGDILTNPTNGGMQRIIWLHPIEKHDYYRVHFVDGTHIDCSEGHLWTLHQSRKRLKRTKFNEETGIDTVWTTKSMFEWYQRKKNGMYNGCNLIIPLTKPVKFTLASAKPKIDPYILGAIIGDGCISNTLMGRGVVEFSTMDEEIVNKFIEAGYDMSTYYQQPGNRAKSYYIRNDELINEIKKLGIAGNKSKDHWIPFIYKYSSIENRIRLMQGLMDTDGYVDSRGHMIYTSISEELAKDVAFIVRSLGGVATITQNKACYKKEGEFIQCNDTFDVQIRSALGPELCSLTRKKERARYEFNGGASELGKRIIDIEYIGIQEGRCITVDDPSGLFIAGDFTVTHNSYLGSAWLLSSCLRWPDMRMVVGRKTLKSLRESTWNTICMIAREWGLKEGENYKVNNLSGEMVFYNDSRIIMKELAYQPSDEQYMRFGSSEYSGAFIDEAGEIDEKAMEVLFSRIRWKVQQSTVVPKLLMSTNPCLGWIRSRFVLDDNLEEVECRQYERYIPFSVYDNPDPDFRRQYLNSLTRISDKATRERLLYGNWQWTETNEMAAYWNFEGNEHLVSDLKESVYDPLKPLICGWDFNVSPYMSELEVQIDYDKRRIYVLEENIGRPELKENNTPKLAKKVHDKLVNAGHLGGVIITGDPAGCQRTTQTEEGVNNYTIIMDNMRNNVLRPRVKLLQKQPPQTTRLEFVNAIFKGFDGWKIQIDMRCHKLTEDMTYQKKNSDGTKAKKKSNNPKTGVKEERYGHLSDILDYVLVLFLNDSWRRFQNQRSTIETYTAPVYGTFEF